MPKFSLERVPNLISLLEAQRNNTHLDFVRHQQNRRAQQQAVVQQSQQSKQSKQVAQHIVKKGDSPWSIAKKAGISLDELYNYNPGLKGKTIYPGDKLKLESEYETRIVNLKDEQALEESQQSQQVAQHIVKKGDSPWSIAKKAGISLDELYNYNPGLKGKTIYPGDKLKLEPEYETRIVNLKDEQALEESLDGDNFRTIQSAPHDSNYAIIDKKNSTLQIFDRNNTLLYTTNDISTGASGNDYNTITYVDKNGIIRNGQGNNSTPAGILTITGRGEYHGYPSFTRGRRNLDGTIEDVASSMHYGSTANKKASNGCVRVSGKSLEDMSKYLGVGDQVYTLPEQAGSKFVLRAGKLNFVADNPYGETEGSKKYWDDYNVQIDKSYSPLVIKPKGNGDPLHDIMQLCFANTLSTNKQKLQAELHLSSSEYNRLAQLAMGIGEQESKFGTSKRYTLKTLKGYDIFGNVIPVGDVIQDIAQFSRSIFSGDIKGAFKHEGNSKGLTQIKYEDDIKNPGLKKLYDAYGITDKSLDTPQGAAIATMLRLGFVYNNEIKGGSFKDNKGKRMNLYDALLYKYNGRHYTLKSGQATPDNNIYLKNVKAYANQNDYFEERKYRK